MLGNVSRFRRCTFITDGGLPKEGEFPAAHVAMSGVRGIGLLGCTWRNTLFGPPLPLSTAQGVGVSSMRSSFTVMDDCTAGTLPCPTANTTSSTFANLHRGVEVTTFDPSRTFTVDHATFTACDGGIRMEGVQDPAITNNSFDVAEPFVPGLVSPTYGVYSDQCTGYSIQENSFTTSYPEGHKKVGLVIKDSGTAPNLVYNNSFDALYTGTLVEGTNRNSIQGDKHEGDGLEIRCNDYGQVNAINTYDVSLTGTNPTIAKQQGRNAQPNPNFPPDPTKPAGNVFSDNCSNPVGDYRVQLPSEYIQYWYHTSQTVHTQPQCFNFIDPWDALAAWPGKGQACPSHLNSGHIVKKESAQAGMDGYNNTSDAYVATKDDGDSEGLLDYVSSAVHSSSAKRDALLAVAPKVSLQVFTAALAADPPMSSWHITQALVANSPLQGEVLKMVEGSGLDAYYVNLVMGAQSGEVSLLSVLEAEMAAYQQQKQEALYDLGREAWFDSTGTGLDSLLLWTDMYEALHAPLAMSGIYTAKSDYAAVEAVATDAQSGPVDGAMYTMFKLLAQTEQAAGWEQPDAATMQALQDLAQQRDVIGSAQANAWLHALGQQLPPEIIILPEDEVKRALPVAAPRSSLSPAPFVFEAFPNPTNGAQWITYTTRKRPARLSWSCAISQGGRSGRNACREAFPVLPSSTRGAGQQACIPRH